MNPTINAEPGKVKLTGEAETDKQLVNPPTAQTKLVKKVKVKTLRPIRIKDEENGTKDIPAGEIVEVTEAEAKEYCDTKFVGSYDFFGKRLPNVGDTVPRSVVVRAQRVA